MSSLSIVDKIQFEKLLRMESGYVLDFSDNTYQAFIGESIGIDIFDEKYKIAGGGSKAKRMRAFWAQEPDHVVGKLLNDLMRYMLAKKISAEEIVVSDCKAIVERLLERAPAETRGPMLFISYARPDLVAVKAAVALLTDAGLNTWFDKKDLKGGQDWEFEIRKRIAEASLFLVCLSTNAADRKGFYHKEMRYAVDEAMKLPKGKVYIMPVRLNECPYPDDLSRFHAIDLFEPDASRSLLKSIGHALNCGVRASDEAHAAFVQAMQLFNLDI